MNGYRTEPRVLGLVAFFASPFLIVVLSVLVHPIAVVLLGGVGAVYLVRSERHRAVGFGLLAGTAVTCAAAAALVAMVGGVD